MQQADFVDTPRAPRGATATETLFCANGELDLFATGDGLVIEVAEERERGVESVALLQLTLRDAKQLRRKLDRVLRGRPRSSPGPMVLIPSAEYRRLVECERAIAALPDAVAPAMMEAVEMERASWMSSNRKTVAVRDLGVLGHSATALWSYNTKDRLRDVLAPGYFDAATDELESPFEWGARRLVSPGDWIMISASDGGALAWVSKDGRVVAMPMAREPDLEAA